MAVWRVALSPARSHHSQKHFYSPGGGVAWRGVCLFMMNVSLSVSKCCSPEVAGMDQLPWEFS